MGDYGWEHHAAELSEHSSTRDLTGYMVYLANKKQETFAHLLCRLIPVQAKVTHDGPAANVNLNLNMPLSEMIDGLEQKIKAATLPRLIEQSPTLLEHEPSDQDA